jgi:hypothetical protein
MGKGTGKGVGKGDGRGGFVDIFQEMEDTVKGCVCCICMMLIGGPICLLVGVSYIGDATTDSRGMAIASFKSDVATWSATKRGLFDDQTFSIKMPTDAGTRPLRKLEAGDPQQDNLVGAGADLGSESVDGDTSWAAWTPLFYQAQVTVPGVGGAGGGPIELRSGSASTAAIWTDQAGLAKCKQDVVDVEPCAETCSSSRRRRRSGGSSSCTTCSSRCSSAGGNWDSAKHSCSRHLILTEVNLVASGSPAAWVFSGLAYSLPEHADSSVAAPTHQPADGGTYTTVPGSCPTPFVPTPVPLTVRSENDPVVKAARLTDYTFDFGNTQAENATIGSTLVIIGMILTALPCCGAFVVYKLISNRRSTQQSRLDTTTIGSAPGGYAPPQMGMQPMVAGNPVYSGQPGMPQPQHMQPQQPQYVQQMQAGLPMATATAVAMPMAAAVAVPTDQQQQQHQKYQQPQALVASAPPPV